MGFFEDFAKRVLDSARFGKLGERDASSLKRLLDKTKKRNTILARTSYSTWQLENPQN